MDEDAMYVVIIIPTARQVNSQRYETPALQ